MLKARSGLVVLVTLCVALMLVLTPARAENVQIKPGNITLNGYLEVAPGASLTDGVVLMVHGTLAHGKMEIMSTLQRAFAERGINTLAITLGLGIDNREGMYDCAIPHNHRNSDAVKEIDAWVAWLKEQGVGRIALLGHSRGGNQASWYLADYDEPAVEKLILIAPRTWSAHEDLEEYKSKYNTPLDSVFKRAKALVESARGGEYIEVPGFLYCENVRVTADTFVDYYEPDERFDTPTVLFFIKKPVLVFTGSEDTVVPDLPEKMEPLSEAANIRWEVIEGADHFFRDLYAEDVADISVEFLGWK
jgi:pimeloyl-ACP methyl ester carboxylesterase